MQDKKLIPRLIPNDVLLNTASKSIFLRDIMFHRNIVRFQSNQINLKCIIQQTFRRGVSELLFGTYRVYNSRFNQQSLLITNNVLRLVEQMRFRPECHIMLVIARFLDSLVVTQGNQTFKFIQKVEFCFTQKEGLVNSF